MSFYDIVIDFLLFDAFDDLENPPTSVTAILQNRWLTSGFKETVRVFGQRCYAFKFKILLNLVVGERFVHICELFFFDKNAASVYGTISDVDNHARFVLLLLHNYNF